MKTRTGFVSNSSSSSFIIKLSEITEQQHINILDWLDNPTSKHEYTDNWTYRYDGETLSGWTSMDNGDFGDWLIENNLVDKVEIEGDNY